MVYELEENKIYSYIYEDFKNSLNNKSQKTLEEQYREAMSSKKIVLFIRDAKEKKFKSFII